MYELIESIQKQLLLNALSELVWTLFPHPSYEVPCMLINIAQITQNSQGNSKYYENSPRREKREEKRKIIL